MASLVGIALPTGARGRNEHAGIVYDGAKVELGFAIAPVPLNLRGKDMRLVGLGSYIVNAQGVCSACHTTPNYAPGHDPFLGQPMRVNVATYLGGGAHFGQPYPETSRQTDTGNPPDLAVLSSSRHCARASIKTVRYFKLCYGLPSGP